MKKSLTILLLSIMATFMIMSTVCMARSSDKDVGTIPKIIEKKSVVSTVAFASNNPVVIQSYSFTKVPAVEVTIISENENGKTVKSENVTVKGVFEPSYINIGLLKPERSCVFYHNFYVKKPNKITLNNIRPPSVKKE